MALSVMVMTVWIEVIIFYCIHNSTIYNMVHFIKMQNRFYFTFFYIFELPLGIIKVLHLFIVLLIICIMQHSFILKFKCIFSFKHYGKDKTKVQILYFNQEYCLVDVYIKGYAFSYSSIHKMNNTAFFLLKFKSVFSF